MNCELIKRLVLIFLVLLVAQGALAADRTGIALFPFVLQGGAGEDMEPRIRSLLGTELGKTGTIDIVPDEKVAQALSGKKIDEKQAFSVGGEIGADIVIMGTVTALGGRLSANLEALGVAEKIIYGDITAAGNTTDEGMTSLAAELARVILVRIFPSQVIAKVEIQGNSRIEENVILNVMSVARGKPFSQKDLSADIKAVYGIGYFNDVTATVTESPEGLVIRLSVQEMPLVSEVNVAGNDDVKKEDITAVITVEAHEVLNLDKVADSVENIKNLYKNKGFYNAEVTYRIEEKENKATVTFDIKEKKKIHIKTITFEGNEAYTAKELRDMMDTSEWGIFSFITDSGILNEDKLKQDMNKLAAFYLNNGYINIEIGDPVITHDEKWLYVTITVKEGKQFRVGHVSITGDTISVPREKLFENLNITKKDHFDREAIMKDIDYLTEAFNNEGYAYAAVSPLTTPREEEQQVDITYNIEKGELVYINRITITGNTVTRDKVVRRELDVVEGDLYNRGDMRSSYANINRLRYFEEINFQTERGLEADLMDINVNVREQPTGMFSVGAGYSAVDQFIVMTRVSQRNLFGRGQTLGVSAYLGSSTTNFELSFIEPWLFDMPLWSKYEIWHMRREYDAYDLQTMGFETTFGYPLWKEEDLMGYIGYRFSIDEVTEIADNASTYVKEQEGETTSSGVTLTLSRDTTDDIFFPSKGSKNSFSVEHTGTIFQGDTSFTKYQATSTWFFPLPLETVFSVRGRAGYLHGNEGKDVPIYERFYLGGINSLRGLREIGPVDPETDDVIGGETMLNFNVEFIFPLIKDAGLKGVIFYDAGNAWESGYHIDDMRETAGAGIRWYSPVGPLRVEWGYVLDRKEDEPPSRWEFTVGMFM
ncbi:MAG: outer membrane protein assembly factor BamA [Deltaproteobacteria bacterium]|nr:outer membrane protein assembly factor BamA [Deltaproteobacteria bacterium]